MFSEISQFIMAQTLERDASELADSLSVFTPTNKNARSAADNNLTKIPDVRGMGAKDAVYVLKKRGLKVNLQGVGSVKSQSIAPGGDVTKGQSIKLFLE